LLAGQMFCVMFPLTIGTEKSFILGTIFGFAFGLLCLVFCWSWSRIDQPFPWYGELCVLMSLVSLLAHLVLPAFMKA
jgi:hypothetical protein